VNSLRSLEAWLRRVVASEQGRNILTMPWANFVQPVEIVSDATSILQPYQRRVYWDRVARSAGAATEFSFVGIAPQKYPTRIHYWQVETISAGNSFLGLLNPTLLGAVTGNVAPLEPIEGPRDFTTTVPFSMVSTGSAGNDGQVVGARVCDWIQAVKPVIWPGQIFASQTITDATAITCVFCFEELPIVDPVSGLGPTGP
jgi:hypothetical protein